MSVESSQKNTEPARWAFYTAILTINVAALAFGQGGAMLLRCMGWAMTWVHWWL